MSWVHVMDTNVDLEDVYPNELHEWVDTIDLAVGYNVYMVWHER